MRNFMLPIVLAASLAASSMAMAATGTTTSGVIKSMDAKTCSVTLDNKSVYQFGANCDLSKLKAGEKVAITSVKNGKLNAASAIVPTK